MLHTPDFNWTSVFDGTLSELPSLNKVESHAAMSGEVWSLRPGMGSECLVWLVTLIGRLGLSEAKTFFHFVPFGDGFSMKVGVVYVW